MNFENLENLEITKEDTNMHYECITEVEKNFINFVRNFRTQGWLKCTTLEMVEDTVKEMVDLSLGEIAFEGAIRAREFSKSGISETYQRFMSVKDNIENFVEEDEMKEITDRWNEIVKSTVVDNLTEYLDSVELQCDDKRLDKQN